MSLSIDSPLVMALIDETDVDRLEFGVIGFDASGYVRVYNRAESVAAGLSAERVLGQHVFESLAPCMNNELAALRFENASRDETKLDAVIDYVLTLRMRPTPVRMRLLQAPGRRYRYILIERTA